MLDAVAEACRRADEQTLSAGGTPATRYVWLAPLGTSPNLIAGHFHPGTFDPGTAERAAREEDAEAALADARAHAREVFEYVGPDAGDGRLRGVCRPLAP